MDSLSSGWQELRSVHDQEPPEEPAGSQEACRRQSSAQVRARRESPGEDQQRGTSQFLRLQDRMEQLLSSPDSQGSGTMRLLLGELLY